MYVQGAQTTAAQEKSFALKRSILQPNYIVHQQLTRIYKPAYDKWLRSFGLRYCWETHKDCTDKEIWHGYRPNPSSFIYCLKSAFYPSNETLNAWTHFIPFLLLLWKIVNVFKQLEDPFEEITFPLWIHSFGICAVLFASSMAHLFSCYSAVVQELCYCLDYGMIPVFGLSVTISVEHYHCSYRCFGFFSDQYSHLYLLLVVFVSIGGSYLTCLSRYPLCPAKRAYRFGPYAACFLFGSYPCFVRYAVKEFFSFGLLTFKEAPDHCWLGEEFSSLFMNSCIFFAVAGIFVVSRFPERLLPGAFDIVGCSHQWFHICTAVGMYWQLVMTESALKHAIQLRDKRQLDEHSLRISIWSTFVPVISFLIILPFIILRTAFNVGRIIECERQKSN